MPVKNCSRHPDQETMVPCLGCGKDFCRICDPPRGAGQLCPRCYQDSLRRFSEKKKTEKKEKVKGASGGVTLGSARLAGVGASKGAAAAKGPARQGLRGRFGRLDLAGRARRLVATVMRFVPIWLEDKEKAAEVPPLAKTWWRLLAVAVAGTALWTIVVVLTHRRLSVVSVIAAVIVAAGVVLVLGVGQDLPVAVLATAIAVLALVLGEMLVQLLYSAQVIKHLDIHQVANTLDFENTGVFYKGFFYNLLVLRLLPPAAAAFIVGLWPFPKTLAWRGFRAGKQKGSRA